jgi:hypothetical protein
MKGRDEGEEMKGGIRRTERRPVPTQQHIQQEP